MAKKKKPAANPARGFATTSIASKPKPERAPEAPEANSDIKDNSVKSSDETTCLTSAIQKPAPEPDESRGSHHLTAEELEKNLEDAELQGLVEKYAAKSQRDSSRHTSKLTTDFRLLKGHAQPLPLRGLLSEDVVAKIVEVAKDDVNVGRLTFADETSSRRITLQEEDTTAKLWTLQRTLLALGFNDVQIGNVFKFLLEYPPSVEQVGVLWGLEECLDWLVLNANDEDLPVFDPATGKIREAWKVESMIDTPDGSTTPNSIIDTPKNGAVESHAVKDITPPDSLPEDDGMVVSDLESDLEPDELLATYLSTKLRLYEARPELLETNKRKSGAKATLTNGGGLKESTGIRKLQSKLQKIESDVLFDQRDAEQRWLYKRNELAQEFAERRKLQLPVPVRQIQPRKNVARVQEQRQISRAVSESSSASSSSEDNDDDDDIALGDLFGAIPSDAPKEPQAQGTAGNGSAADTSLAIRDFGPVQGLTPSRIFEEACRARDARSTVVFRPASSTAFSHRSTVTITWSKDQDTSFPLQMDVAESNSKPRSCTFTMISVATPDSQQAKAYISTFALFQIFSTSPREEKAYLRLAPAWRDLWMEFVDQRRSDVEKLDRDTVRALRDLVRQKLESEDGNDDVVLTRNFQKRILDPSGRSSSRNSDSDLAIVTAYSEQHLKELWLIKSSAPSYQRMLIGRMGLPMFKFRDAALATVEQNQVTILCGETGCGKSTQMPSFILERELSLGRPCKIYCTEPRRISAITLAQRVSEELGENKHDVGTLRSLVGYAIRLESHVSSSTRLVFATTGIVLRMLESRDGFEGVTHIVIDEVHERSIETDFLLIILRSLVAKRPDLKVILMSATVDAQRFSSYFYGAPILTVPGRTFPVDTRYLEDAIESTGYSVDESDRAERENDDDVDTEEKVESGGQKTAEPSRLQGYSARTRNALTTFDEYRIDYQLILKLINMIAFDAKYSKYNKAILVFLPGIAEIRRLNDLLHGTPIGKRFLIHALHSSIASEDQQAAFNLPPRGMGKIVISTNIAETGVTIPDVTCVIDTGKHKEMRFDERRQISRLIESFISRANAKQRRGRAGRVQEGLCFHLFTKARHDEAMSDQQTPEMLRLSLQDLVMRVKICKLGDIQSTLAEALDPPSAKNIRRAIDALIEVGALTTSEDLTSLGLQLAKLPLDPYLGKLVLFGAIFGCLDISLTLAAILTSKSPFVTPIGGRAQADAARQYFKRGDSDLLTEYNAYTAWRRVCSNTTHGPSNATSEYQFCRKSSLSPQTLAQIEDLKAQLLSSLASAGLVPLDPTDRTALSRISNSGGGRHRRFVDVPEALDAHSGNNELVASVVAWSFYPKLLTRDGKGWRNVASNQSITIHPTSIVRGASIPNVKFLSFYSILQSSGTKNYNANSLTPCSALPLVLLAGDATFHPTAQVVSIDGARLRFMVEGWKTFVAIKYLRRRLEEVVDGAWKGKSGEAGRRLERWVRVWTEVVEGWAGVQAAREG